MNKKIKKIELTLIDKLGFTVDLQSNGIICSSFSQLRTGRQRLSHNAVGVQQPLHLDFRREWSRQD